MPISVISLDNIKLVERISLANVGSVLQFFWTGVDSKFVGLKVEAPAPSGVSSGVVLLEGEDAGVFLTDADINNCPALDITHLVEISCTNCAPQQVGLHQTFRGQVYQASDNSERDFFCISVSLANTPGVLGYARLTGTNRGKLNTVSDRIYIGRPTVVEK